MVNYGINHLLDNYLSNGINHLLDNEIILDSSIRTY